MQDHFPPKPGRPRVKIVDDWATGNRSLYLHFSQPTGPNLWAVNMVFNAVALGTPAIHGDIKPLFSDTREDRLDNLGILQAIMDEMWASGIRPRDVPPEHAGQLQATVRHLEDMRTLVFNQPKKMADEPARS